MPWRPANLYALLYGEDFKNALHAINQLELEIQSETWHTDADLGQLLDGLDELRV
jgi:hypothetical protein